MLVSNLTQGNRQERGEKHPMSPALDKQHAYSLSVAGARDMGSWVLSPVWCRDTLRSRLRLMNQETERLLLGRPGSEKGLLLSLEWEAG